MTQPSLFDICENHHGHNPQSVAANRDVAPAKQSMRMRILEWFTDREATCEEAEIALGIKHQTLGARLAEMKREGTIISTGRTKPTSSGCSAEILRARVEW